MMQSPEQVPLILVVEDSKLAVFQLTKKIEEDLGFEVVSANTFASARKIITQRGPDIFVAILDLTLPDAPQGEVVDFAVAHDVPSIVFTSAVSVQTRKRMLDKQVIDYVVKNRQALNEVAYTIGRLHKNQGLKVLVVDDSKSIRKHLRSLLELYMLQVFEAESGEQALEILQRDPDITLVITDYEMGGMNGVELTSFIRTRYNRDDLAIIGISSRTNKALSVQFIKQGADDYLDKPFEKEEFFCRISHNIESIERQKRLLELDELKNRFLGMAAHDLRNPINAVKGFTELLLSEDMGTLSDDHREMISFVNKASIQMNDLVNDLLDITVIESGRLELELAEESLSEIVEERVRVMRIPAEHKGIEIKLELERGVVAWVDRNRMCQVVDNLLSNALKFSPSGTTVFISVSRRGEDVVIGVADQGLGIPEAEQDKLFDSFQRLSTRPTAGESSTGLGLVIVKKMVEAHKGSIRVKSEPNRGSSFIVVLPTKQ